ncbi:PilZ domain-containing protein [Thiomicrorhabdus sp. Milos-T2]|uniref:PilZ domain-containing protein n=1 Tax=Thiomicrorhabdus sp. Milos-T2 TaxID=90814 RepID=UPI000494954A|nr:PilZ domain-containing protein [Thiomicrorhabdus sp. Milos-T2]
MKTPIYKTERKALLIGKNATAEATLVDLSIHEAGVITPRGAKEGTELKLQFEIPTQEEFTTLTLNTIVTDRHNAEDKIYLKLEFEPLNSADKNALKQFFDYKQRLINMGKRQSID